MKKNMVPLFVLALCLILTVSLPAAYTVESALGIWLVPGDNARVTIYKCGENVCGRISWLKTPEDLDKNNPDPAKRNDRIIGMNILWGFTFDGSVWSGGYIYDPDSGSVYKCKMWLDGDGRLNVKGFMGVSLLGRSEIWTRVK